MNGRHDRRKILSRSLILLGILMVISAIAMGDTSIGIILIIPFITISGPIGTIGFLLIIAGFFFSHLSEVIVEEGGGEERTAEHGAQMEHRPVLERGERSEVRAGGIIFIGPIPIIFGDNRSMRYLLPVAVVILILMIIAGLYL